MNFIRLEKMAKSSIGTSQIERREAASSAALFLLALQGVKLDFGLREKETTGRWDGQAC